MNTYDELYEEFLKKIKAEGHPVECPKCGHMLRNLPGLTKRQQDVLDVIQTSERDAGPPPSYQEMADAVGLKSKSGIHRLILELEERGYIQRLPWRSRSIKTVAGLGS